MSESPCIQCGQPAGDPPRLNHLPNGLPCMVCRDRLLEALPSLLPGQPEVEAMEEMELEEVEEASQGFQPRYLAGDVEEAPEGAEPA